MQKGAGRQKQRRGKWCLPGFSIDPGHRGPELVACGYIFSLSHTQNVAETIQTQVVLPGAAGREVWLGVELCKGSAAVTMG